MFENPQMDKEYFKLLADQFRSPHLWTINDGNWELRNSIK